MPWQNPHPTAWALKAGLPLPQAYTLPQTLLAGLSPGPLCPNMSRAPDPHPHFGVSRLCLEAPGVGAGAGENTGPGSR